MFRRFAAISKIKPSIIERFPFKKNYALFWRNMVWTMTSGIFGIRSPFQGFELKFPIPRLRRGLTYFAPLGLGWHSTVRRRFRLLDLESRRISPAATHKEAYIPTQGMRPPSIKMPRWLSYATFNLNAPIGQAMSASVQTPQSSKLQFKRPNRASFSLNAPTGLPTPAQGIAPGIVHVMPKP